MAPPSPTPLRAVNSALALMHAESIRKTDDLARAHGAQLLEYAELAFIGRVIGTAELGRKISGDDFDELVRLSTRAVNSDYVAFDGIEQMRALLDLIDETDKSRATPAPQAVKAEPSIPGIAASGPIPELPPVRHRARPSASCTPAAPAAPVEDSGPEPASTDERHPAIRHRTRPIMPEAKKPPRPVDDC